VNPFQRRAADTYAGGDYAHIETADEADDMGDTLFLFVIHELEDVDSEQLFESRIRTAIRDLEDIL
jgi:hypothetical protein